MKKPFIPQYEIYEDMSLLIDQLNVLNHRLVDKSEVSKDDITTYLKYWDKSLTELTLIKNKLTDKITEEQL